MKKFCEKCKKKTCLKTGKPCRKVENYLAREQSANGYSERWIRTKEIPINPTTIDFFAIECLHRRKGRKKFLYSEGTSEA